MSSQKIGLIIGRFQPFHKGHLYLLQQAVRQVDRLVIGIGSSNVEDSKNPYSFERRKEMLEKVLHNEDLSNKVIKIIPLEDDPSDEVWFDKTMEVVDLPIDLYIGNDDWTTGIFEEKGIKVLRIPYFKREIYEGTLIRSIIDKNGDWKEKVPAYLIPFLQV